MSGEVYWAGKPEKDDFGQPIKDVIYDARTRMGSWAFMTFESWEQYRASPDLGTGFGQKFRKQDDGRFLKVLG
jgi:hypothetical protein